MTIKRAAELTGYSENAIRIKIKTGVWTVGSLVRRGPDGRILVDLEAYERWVQGRATMLPTRKPVR